MDERNLERIDRYLRKEMSSEENRDFEQEALNNAELLEEVDLSYRVKRSLTDRQRKLYITSKWRNKKRDRIIRLSTITSVAAILLVGIFLWSPLNNDISVEEPLLAAVEDKSIENVQQKREKVLQTVKNSIEEGREENAVELIEQLERVHEIPTLEDISMGRLVANNLLSNEKSDTLEIHFDAYELHWLKICALIKIGKSKEAKAELETFVKIDGMYKHRADSVLLLLMKEME